MPIFVYLVRAQVFALPLTNVDVADGGVTGNVSKVFSDPSLRLVNGVSRAAIKSDGTVAVAYLAYDHAYYAEWSGKMEDVPVGSMLASPSISGCALTIGLGIDRRDQANIVFCGSNGANTVYYATVKNGTWSVETIGKGYTPYPAVAADSSGNVVVGLAGQFASSPGFVIATRRGAAWAFESPDPADGGATTDWNFDPFVVVDSIDNFNLFFKTAPPSGAVIWREVAWWVSAGSAWKKTNATAGGYIGQGNGYHFDVALTAGGELYIARVGAGGGIAYDHFDGCRWTSHEISFPGTATEIWWPSVAVDPSGRPHFSFQEMHPEDHSQDALWSAEPIP